MNNKGLKWDVIKMQIRSNTISYTSFKSKEKKLYEEKLKRELNELEEKLANNPDEDVQQHYFTNIKELEQINNERTKGRQLRAHALHVEFNEKNSEYFYKKEIGNAKIKNISVINMQDGTKITGHNEIINCQKDFYNTLYTETNVNNPWAEQDATDTFLNDNNITQLDDNDKDNLENKLNMQEIAEATKALPNLKSPGSDGLPVDFYKKNWNDIKSLVLDSITHAINTGEMSVDQKRGILSLIPKKEKDIRFLKNWRPLTLLNTDYNFFAKAMATRLQSVLPHLISTDQSGCIKGRSTFTNIRSTIDIINYVNEKNLGGIIAYIDFQKAFDTVRWKFMYSVLKKMNFGPYFMHSIKTMYQNIQSCIMNNGYTSDFFTPTRGIRQGCPISAYIFILVAEVLAHSIRQNNNVKGIKINQIEYKLSQYADDTCLYMENQESLRIALHIFESFTVCSGLKINKDKSEAIWIGSSSNFRHKPFNLKWAKGANYLGIYIANNTNEATHQNFKEKIQKIKDILGMWTLRKLTLIGKIQIVNTLALSQLLYAGTVLAMPKMYITEYNKIIKEFLWNKKPPKVKYTTLIGPIEEGGLKLHDLNCKLTAIKLKWIKQLTKDGNPPPWKSYIAEKCQCQPAQIPTYNLNINHIPNFSDPFHKELFNMWTKIHYHEPQEVNEITYQTLWNNSCIITAGKPCYYKNWGKKGITHVQDIITSKGQLMTTEEIRKKYDLKCKFLEYQSLISAISPVWKKKLKELKEFVPVKDMELNVSIKLEKARRSLEDTSTKNFYQSLVNITCKRPTSEAKWAEKLTFEITDDMWTLIYTNNNQVTKDTTIRNFQYKITHRILAVNYNLKIWKIKNTNICDKCDQVDTIEHYLVECPHTHRFWQQLFKWWSVNMNIWFEINTYEILFGIPNERDEAIINQMNFFIIYCKYYIYCCKKKAQSMNVYEMIKECRKQLMSKRECMIENENDDIFVKRWGELYDCVS
jgi:hypothetical protein